MKRVLTHGTFDIIHYGHIRYLNRAHEFGDYMIVLISSDKYLQEKTDKKPYFNENIRSEIISSIKGVDEVILRDNYIDGNLIKRLNIDVFVTTDTGFNYDYLKDFCEVIVIERTKDVSSTEIKNHLNKEN